MSEKCELCKKYILENDRLSSHKTCGDCNMKWKNRTVAGFCGNCGENKLPKHSNSICDLCDSTNAKPKGFE